MSKLKITCWNIKHLSRLTGDALDSSQQKRRDAISEEIQAMSPDILCIVEGPRSEAGIDQIAEDWLSGDYKAVKLPDGTNPRAYELKGTQWIWFLVKTELAPGATLLAPAVWNELTRKTWSVNYWGEYRSTRHSHYRHPQVLILDLNGQRVEFIGLHLKSKFVMRGQSDWKAGGERRRDFIRDALKARVKLATEASNVRDYINAKFEQVVKPAIFVLGDLNDGPGKELFEQEYLFFDLLSNIQGDVFAARRFLNHALFDYPAHLRWSAEFNDFILPQRNPRILLDHILFTQPLVDGSLPIQVEAEAGLVEHEVHDLINARLSAKQKTSDHKPVSVMLSLE